MALLQEDEQFPQRVHKKVVVLTELAGHHYFFPVYGNAPSR